MSKKCFFKYVSNYLLHVLFKVPVIMSEAVHLFVGRKKNWNPPKYLLIACLDQSAALFVLQFSLFHVFLSDSKNCLKILHGQLISSHKVPSIGRQWNTFNKPMVGKMLQSNRVLTFIIVILFDLEHQIIVKLWIPPFSQIHTWSKATFSPINYLRHRPSPRASF